MYVLLHTGIHKDIDTFDNRDRLNSQRHVLVQAAVTTQLCHHTRHLPQRQRTGNQTCECFFSHASQVTAPASSNLTHPYAFKIIPVMMHGTGV